MAARARSGVVVTVLTAALLSAVPTAWSAGTGTATSVDDRTVTRTTTVKVRSTDWRPGARSTVRRIHVSSGGRAARSVPFSARGRKTVAMYADSVARRSLPMGSDVVATGRVRGTESGRVVGLRLTEHHAGRIVQRRYDRLRIRRGTWYDVRTSLRTRYTGSRVKAKVYIQAAGRRHSVVGFSVRVRSVSRETTTPTPTPDPTSPTPTPTSPTPPVAGDGRCTTTLPAGVGRRTFSEDFDGSSLDPSRWRVRDNTYLNHDAAWLTKDNVTVADGRLTITGRRMAAPVSTPNGSHDVNKTRQYSSGYVDTIGKFSQRYGYFEACLQSPTGLARRQGVWPAFWLRGDTSAGEIDVFEGYGETTLATNRYDPRSHAEWTVWQSTSQGSRLGSFHGRVKLDDPAGWHAYGVRWTPGALEYYVDGRKVASVSSTSTDRRGNPGSWLGGTEFSSPFHLRLNLQMGNSYWGWPGPDVTADRSDLGVDWVRVYEPTT